MAVEGDREDGKEAVSSPRLSLAIAALVLEGIWPRLWPALGILGAYLALALFDIPARLPGVFQTALLAGVAAAIVAAIILEFRDYRWPRRLLARRRIERDSGLAHRPLAALEDRLASGADDPAAQALWQAHRARMVAQVENLPLSWPKAGLVRRDPYGLRAILVLVLLLGFVDAGDDWTERLGRALVPSFAPHGIAAAASLDIWLTPPDYTGLPPRLLPKLAGAVSIEVPAGSTVLAQVHGGYGTPRVDVDGKANDFTPVDDDNFTASTVLKTGHRLAVEQGGGTLGSWPIVIVPDWPPSIVFGVPPQKTDRGALRLEYKASDDYGVEGVKAIIVLADNADAAPLTLDLPLPGAHLKEAHATSFHDLSAHPWAGLRASITLQAIDALGQSGVSETIQFIMPEREFHNPIARAIVAQRKELSLHPKESETVAETLSDLSLRPGLYGEDKVVFLALRTAQARLRMNRDAETIPAVQQLLWETALRIEDGRAPMMQQDVRQSMKSLQEALARNASDAEINQLMQQLRQAMDRYMQALADKARRDGLDKLSPMDPSQMLNAQDLQKMLDRARDMARTGDRDAARDLLSQLQDMLENLQMARPGQAQNGASQMMGGMQDMMRRQQKLLDQSFRDSQQGKGDEQGASQAQEALRRMLGDMMRGLGEDGEIPQSLGQAERAMRGAGEALKQGEPGDAIEPQTEALDQLQQAARSLGAQMKADGTRPGEGQPGQDAERDPFGREPMQEGGVASENGRMRMGSGKGNGNAALDRAKNILDELRRRAGERARPEIERDYIDRLLKEF